MYKHLLKKCTFFVLLLVFLFPEELYAVDDPSATALTGTGTSIVKDNMRASNPDCAMAAVTSLAAFIGIFVGVGLVLAGYITFSAGEAIAKTVGIVMMITGVTAVVLGILAIAEWAACAFAFVKHPVLRYGTDDASGHTAGKYRECSNPSVAFPSACRKTFQNEDDYFVCIDQHISGLGTGGSKADQIERGQKKEPRCKSGVFKEVSDYIWPQNRTPNSEFLEVCYRNPMGATYVMATGGVGIIANIIMNPDLNPREYDFGTTDLHNFKKYFNGDVDCAMLQVGESAKLHGIKYTGIDGDDGDVCVEATGLGDFPWFIRPRIGCHKKPAGPPSPMCASSKPTVSATGRVTGYDNRSCFSCYVAEACMGYDGGHTFAYFPLASVIVECLRESLSNMLTAGCLNSQTGQTEKGFLLVAQQRLKNAVNAVLVLACMLLATKAISGGLQQPQGEMIMFLLKLSLVVYLTNGSAMSRYYDQLVLFSIGLSDMVLQAGGNQTICDYKQVDYITAFPTHNYSYLAPWDRLDCRLAFYFGSQLNGSTAGTVFVLLLSAGLILVGFILGNIYLIVSLMSLLATIMIIIMICWVLYLFILSMLALSILVLLSPLFLPMMLFQVTKGFYDSWIKELMTYTLYPVMLFAFLAIVFTVYDNIFFEGLEFEREVGTLGATTSQRIWYKLKTTDASGNAMDQCADQKHEYTLACTLDSYQVKKRAIFLGWEASEMSYTKGSPAGFWTRIAIMALLGFLFYHFLSILGSMAAELAGNPRGDLSRGVKSPAQVMQGVMGGANAVRGKIQSIARAGAGAIRDKAAGGKGGDGGGKESASSGDKGGGDKGGGKS